MKHRKLENQLISNWRLFRRIRRLATGLEAFVVAIAVLAASLVGFVLVAWGLH